MMQRKTNLILKGVAILAALSLAASASAQLTQIWKTDAGAASPTWLLNTGDATRGMCYNSVTGHLLVAARGVGNIQVLNASTGAAVGTMTMTGVTGGTYILNKVRTVDLGGGNYSVYVANLTTSTAATELCVYRWTGSASEEALGAPTVIFRQRNVDAASQVASPVPATILLPALGASRFGDTFDVASNGTNTEFYFGIQGVASNRYFKMAYNEGDAAVNALTQVTLAGLAATAVTVYAMHPDGYQGKVYTSSGLTVGRFTNDGTARQGFQSGNMAATITHLNVGTINGVKLMGYMDGDSVLGSAASPYRRPTFAIIANDAATDTTFEARESFIGPTAATQAANGNGTGDIYFDDVNDRVYILVTNNYIGAYSVSLPASPTTVTWDGGASTSNWFDAANWSGDVVPNYMNDVVLDNSTVAGAYSVVVNGTNGATAQVRSLSVGPAATSSATITLQVPQLTNTTASGLALFIAGEQTAAADFAIGQFGRFEQLSSAGSGNIVDNRNLGSTTTVANGGYFLFDCPRSYGTPYAATGDGAIIFGNNATLEFGQTSGTSVSMSGRTYGNLTLSSTAAKTYAATGTGAALINGNLTINGATTTFNPAMTGGLTIGGNVVNNGAAAALSSTGGSNLGVTFTGAAASISGSTATTFPEGLTVASGAALTVPALTIASGKSVVNNGTLNVNGALTLNGNLVVNGPIAGTNAIAVGATGVVDVKTADLSGVSPALGITYNAASSFSYSGSAAQTTAGVPATIGALTVNNAAGVTLAGPVTATTLNLTAGEVATGANTLTATTVNRTAGQVTGTLTRTIDATVLGARDFPVGTAGAYAPVSVNITAAGTGTGTIAVSSTATAAASLPASVNAISRFWNVDATGISGATYTLGFTYLDGDLGAVDETTLLGARYNGSAWTQPGTTVITAASNLATVSGVTALSPWTLYKTNATPGVSGAPLAFGSVVVSSTSDLTFDVTNTGTASMNVTALNFGATGFSVVAPTPSLPFAVAPGVPVTVTVRFSPVAATTYSDTLTVDTDAATDPTVGLSGTGDSSVNEWMTLND